jgi:hypothetical protein
MSKKYFQFPQVFFIPVLIYKTVFLSLSFTLILKIVCFYSLGDSHIGFSDLASFYTWRHINHKEVH